MNRLAISEAMLFCKLGDVSLLGEGDHGEVIVPGDTHLQDVVEYSELCDGEGILEGDDEGVVPLGAVGGDDVVVYVCADDDDDVVGNNDVEAWFNVRLPEASVKGENEFLRQLMLVVSSLF